MRRQVEAEEEACVRERGRRDDVLAGDVHTREADRRQPPDDDEVQELPVAQAQRTNLTYRRAATPASRRRSPSSARTLNVSTSTSGSVPSARVITERCGCVSASSRESLPVFSSSLTREWSSVSCSIRASRIR